MKKSNIPYRFTEMFRADHNFVTDYRMKECIVEVRYVAERERKRFKGFVHRTNYMERTVELANQRDGIIQVPFEAIIHVERSMD